MINTNREQQALARWRPGRRWYHPAMARIVIAVSRLITRRLNRLEIEGFERFEALQRRGDRGLLTISNHVSLFDDPLLVSNLVWGSYQDIRWVGADALNFFGSPFKSWLFTAGKSVPIVRGAGIDQPGMAFLEDRLLAGDWVHIFPEGGRTRDPEGRMAQDFRAGVGWLAAATRPVVLPFYHYGMHRVLPVGAVRPRRGHKIRLLFGDAISCDQAWLAETVGPIEDGPGAWAAIAAALHHHLAALEREVHPAFAGERAAA